jgi:hypothetical protein
MANYSKEMYNVKELWANRGGFTVLENQINEFYNQASWRRFATWGMSRETPDWQTNIASTNLNIAAAVLSVNGTKPPRGMEGWNYKRGTIPMIGHRFDITAHDLLVLRTLSDMPGDPTFKQRASYTERVARLVGGMHNRLNMFVWQGFSTGYAIANTENNGEAIKLLIDLGFKAENRLRPTKVWTDPTADPIQDMLDAQDLAADDPNAPLVTAWLMAKSKIRQLATHPNVRGMVARKMYPNSTVPTEVPLSRKEVITGLTEYFDILPIIEIDEKAAVQEDGGAKTVKSFDESVVVLTNPDNFFEMVPCRPVFADDGNPNISKMSFENGHFVMIVEHFSNPAKITSSIEAFALPVPRNVHNWFAIKTDTTEVWGTRELMEGKRTNATKVESTATKVVVDGEEYLREAVIAALNGMGKTIGTRTSLKNVQAAVDALTEAELATLVAALPAE